VRVLIAQLEEPPRAVDGLRRLGRVDERHKFRSAVRRQIRAALELGERSGIAHHAEKVDDPVVEIIEHFNIAGPFAQQHVRRAAERFDVHAMPRKLRDDPFSVIRLAAVPRDGSARRRRDEVVCRLLFAEEALLKIQVRGACCGVGHMERVLSASRGATSGYQIARPLFR